MVDASARDAFVWPSCPAVDAGYGDDAGWVSLPGAACPNVHTATNAGAIWTPAWCPCPGVAGCRQAIKYDSAVDDSSRFLSATQVGGISSGRPYILIAANGEGNPEDTALIASMDGPNRGALGSRVATMADCTMIFPGTWVFGNEGFVMANSGMSSTTSVIQTFVFPLTELPNPAAFASPVAEYPIGDLGYPANDFQQGGFGGSFAAFERQPGEYITVFNRDGTWRDIHASDGVSHIDNVWVWAGQLYWVEWSSTTIHIMHERAPGLTEPFIAPPAADVREFYSDGVDMVWIEQEPPSMFDTVPYTSQSIWTAPFTTDAGAVHARRVDTIRIPSGDPTPDGLTTEYAGNAVMGFGRYAFTDVGAATGPLGMPHETQTSVVDLVDGRVRVFHPPVPDVGPGVLSSGAVPELLTADELFMSAQLQVPGSTPHSSHVVDVLYRVQLSSLPYATP